MGQADVKIDRYLSQDGSDVSCASSISSRVCLLIHYHYCQSTGPLEGAKPLAFMMWSAPNMIVEKRLFLLIVISEIRVWGPYL